MRGFQHWDVPALKVGKPRIGQGLPPLLRDVERHEPVALAPDKQGRSANGGELPA